ncbi:MAG: AAA family ATPase [Gammaproteobacteria bacterium]
MNTISRFLVPPQNNSFFLLGPRGTGKSTWVNQIYPNATLVNLLDPEIFRAYQAKPERLKDLVFKKEIIIDEVQKVPEILSVVHELIEEKKGYQFILTGSSARKLKRTGVNLLGGRAEKCSLHPFMAAELGKEFDLKTALHTGLIPVVVKNENPLNILQAYVGLYLKEEVQSEGLVRNLGNFARFLEVMSFSQGSTLNVSNIARECQVSRKITEGYLSILEDLMLSFYLPVFAKRAKRKTVSHEKFYYFDVGVFASLRKTGPLDVASEIDGIALESLVAQHLRAWNEYQGAPHLLSYWRTQAGNEVDFIVYGPETFFAIEVKNKTQLSSRDFTGLKAFHEEYPECKPILLYRGQETLKQHNILCISVEKFLRNLIPGKFLL